MKKKLLSVFLALCLCLSLLPTAALAAEETTVTDESALSTAIANNTYDTIKLGGNITLTTTLQVNRTVILDLNGYVLKYENTTPGATGSVIKVTNNATLTLTDSTTATEAPAANAPKHYFSSAWVWESAATGEPTDGHTVRGGIITGGTGTGSPTCGGGVFVDSGSTFTMNGGNIVGCTAAQDGGGVQVGGNGINDDDATFTMSGGSIQGCRAGGNGGGVNLNNSSDTSFKMTGGTIAHCTASNAGGVDCGNGSFTMEGGTIDYCSATNYGGGVQVGGSARFTMKDGKIENCSANNGGGVWVCSDHCALQGGTIQNNTASSNGGGVLVDEGKALTVGGGSTALNITGNTKGSPATPDNICLDTSTGIPTITVRPLANGSTLSLTTTYTSTNLDLTTLDEGDLDTKGYAWDNTTNTLTLKNATFGDITLPNADTTIEIQGNVIVNKIGDASSFTNTLTIEGSGTNPKLTVTNNLEFDAGSLTMENLTANIDLIKSNSSAGNLTLTNATITTGGVNLNPMGSTDKGLVLTSSTLNVNGAGSNGIYVAQITLDNSSTINLTNGYISTNGDGNLSTVPSYCPAGNYSIGVPAGSGSSTRYLLDSTGAKVTNITLRNAPAAPVIPTYRVTVADCDNGTVASSRRYAVAGQTVTLTVSPDTGFALTSLTVTNARGAEVALNDLGGGKYTFKMPASRVTVTAAFGASRFYDPAVDWAGKNGIDVGAPESVCTRAEAVTFLWQAAGSPEVTGVAMPFTDVPANAACYKAVLWAVKNGVTTGTSKTTFSPELGCTRAQIVTFLWRAAGKPAASAGTETFRDVAEGAWYAPAVRWAVENGVTTGTGAGAFSPDAPCTHGQIITMIYRQMAN